MGRLPSEVNMLPINALTALPGGEFDPRIDVEPGIDEFRQTGLFEQGHRMMVLQSQSQRGGWHLAL